MAITKMGQALAASTNRSPVAVIPTADREKFVGNQAKKVSRPSAAAGALAGGALGLAVRSPIVAGAGALIGANLGYVGGKLYGTHKGESALRRRMAVSSGQSEDYFDEVTPYTRQLPVHRARVQGGSGQGITLTRPHSVYQR